MASYCTHCGGGLSPEDRFCKSCGLPVADRENLAAREPTPASDVEPDTGLSPASTEGMKAMGWVMSRVVLLLVLTVFLGAVTALLRTGTGYFPGIQGLVTGALLAWLAGRIGRKDPPGWWSPGQRFWLWLNLTLTFGFTVLLTLSVLLAPPLAAPFDWLSDVLDGYREEYFFGGSLLRSYEGPMSGGWWLAFQVLDAIFFFGLGIVVLGSAFTPDQESGEEEEEDEEDEEKSEPISMPAGPSTARWAFLIQWLLLLGGVMVLGLSDRKVDAPFDREEMDLMQARAGIYRFTDGQGLLAPSGEGGVFRLQPGMAGECWLLSEPEGAYRVALRGSGLVYEGLVYRGDSAIPVRARFAQDGRSVQLAGTVYRQGMYRTDVLLEARRE